MILHAIALALLGLAAADEPCQTPGLTWDTPDNLLGSENANTPLFSAPVTLNSCQDSGSDTPHGSAVEVVQLFTPQSVPWVYKGLCFRAFYTGHLLPASYSTQMPYDLVLYESDPVTGGPAAKPKFTATVKGALTSVWATINWEVSFPRVYMGYRATLPCTQFQYYTFPFQPGRPAFYRPLTTGAAWNRHAADWINGNHSFVAIRAEGSPLTTNGGVPAAWNCSTSFYNDKSTCHCNCGAYDPDCSNSVKGPVSANCATGQVCNRQGSCVDPKWTSCSLKSYGSGDGCQCGCGGALDPDCRDSTISSGPFFPQALNCASVPGVAMCASDGTCAAAGLTKAQLSDGICQCTASGVLDPDCLCVDNVSGMTCNSRSTCGALKCYMGGCRSIPAGWKCPLIGYDSGGDCDCECGGWDPDCNGFQVSSHVIGCTKSYVCGKPNGTCTAPGCGNGVVEQDPYGNEEECDGGSGCSKCQCLPGWQPQSPKDSSCASICRDNIVVGPEECDGGKLCFLENCSCHAGHPPYSPRKLGCQGCGNGILDPGEQCDGGGSTTSGCHPTACTCVSGYEPTIPTTTACIRLNHKCGDGVVQRTEMCDGGAFCVNCTCAAGHAAYSPNRDACVGCGNRLLDDGEECDGGQGCSSSCKCNDGYVSSTPLSVSCVEDTKACNNGYLESNEECDGGAFCTANCTCAPGHYAYSPRELGCSGCQNGFLDVNESCDGGPGCDANCTCNGGYAASVPASKGCVRSSMANKTKSDTRDLAIAVGVPVGVVGLVGVVGAFTVYLVYSTRKRRQAPGMMLEYEHGSGLTTDMGLSTVPIAASVGTHGGVLNSSGGASSFGQYIRSTAPDGTPIYIVPVSARGFNSSGSEGAIQGSSPQASAAAAAATSSGSLPPASTAGAAGGSAGEAPAGQ
eukprot:m51a1_g8685 putative serine-threonine protein (909) ;mRNA; f:6320-10158